MVQPIIIKVTAKNIPPKKLQLSNDLPGVPEVVDITGTEVIDDDDDDDNDDGNVDFIVEGASPDLLVSNLMSLAFEVVSRLVFVRRT